MEGIMTKYLLIACVFLGAVCAFLYNGYDNRGKEIARLETQIKALETEKEGYKNAQISSSEIIKKLRLAVAADKEPVDCYNSPLPAAYRELLNELK